MATLNIFIKAIRKDDGSYALELTDSDANHGIDNLKSKATPGSKVKWKLAKFAGIKIEKIININAKDGSFNVFSDGPKSIGKNWVGMVGDDMSGKIEEYFIEYQIDGTVYLCDPELKIDPPE